MNDLTYSKLNSIKLNIKKFIDKLETIAEAKGKILKQEDKEFYTFIAKHIIFFKYLYNGSNNIYFFKVMISDLYYYSLSLLGNEIRYVYLNERSIIENYTRAVVKKSLDEDYVTENIFLKMKDMDFRFRFSEDDYSLIKSEYVTSCGYIHGGEILNENLAFVLNECLENNDSIKDINKYHARIRKILKIYDKMIISEYTDFISGVFHRQKTILEYLLGKDSLELLFDILKDE